MSIPKQLILCFTSLLISITSFKLSAQNMPGSISATAKYIDADVMEDFSCGVAIIKKGQSYALIDSSGNTVIPWNQWILTEKAVSHFIVAENPATHEYALLNTKGKVLIPRISDKYLKVDLDRYTLIQQANKYFFINAEGKRFDFILPKYQYIVDVGTFSEGLASQRLQNFKYQYVDRTGKVVIPGPFDFANPFNEGVALVGKKNEFQEMMYGFIDKKGSFIIPYKYSIQPGNFCSGLAFVTAKDTSEFLFGYINKKGELMYKLKYYEDEYKVKNLIRPETYSDGDMNKFHFSRWKTWNNGEEYFIDTLGNIYTHKAFNKKFGLPEGANVTLLTSTKEIVNWYNDGCYGLVNLVSKEVIPNIFQFSNFLVFDNESNRILTSLCTKAGEKKITGYINTKGVFVIVKKEGSQF